MRMPALALTWIMPRRAFTGERVLIMMTSVAAGLIIWELVVRLGFVSPLLLSAPSKIFIAFVDLVASGELEKHLIVSGKEFVVGLALALLVGLPIAIAAGWYTRFGLILQPLVAVLFAAPTIALFPLIILFLGIGFWDKVLLVFLSGFLQIYITITSGIRATDHRWIRVARSFRASKARMFWSVVMPGAIPYILLGIRLAIGRSLVNVIVAEMLAAEAGLGYMIAYYGNTFQVANVFVAIGSVVCLGVILDQALVYVDRRVSRWRGTVYK
jgi:ABC-type nitrate/sulfonate/bicarbonate transport system permease component